MSTGCGSGPGQGCAPRGGDSMAPPSRSTVVNSKVMVVAVVVLLAVVLFILCLHIYAKWFWRHQGAAVVTSDGAARASSWRRRRYRGDPRVHNPGAAAAGVAATAGVERAVVEALPVFEYCAAEMKAGLECAVCLEEFEEGEKGRTLPKCGHSFHLDCVDMWLHSHTTCPLCRAGVGADADAREKAEAVVVRIREQPPTGEAAVVGDVGAPFMAAMRASRRRQRSRGQLPAVSSPTGANSLPRTAEDHGGENHGQRENSAGTESSPAADQAAVTTGLLQSLKDYETLVADAQAITRSGPSVRAPFQVSIDIPRAGAGIATNSATVMSPMARASASLRRLLSRGKSVVTPQSPPEGTDEGGPSSSSSSPPPPPPPPPSPPSV